MQGYIEFATAEQALLTVRLQVDDTDLPSAVVVDLDHVTVCHPVAAVLLGSIVDEVARRGVTVVTVDRSGRHLLAASAEFTTRAEAIAHLTGVHHIRPVHHSGPSSPRGAGPRGIRSGAGPLS